MLSLSLSASHGAIAVNEPVRLTLDLVADAPFELPAEHESSTAIELELLDADGQLVAREDGHRRIAGVLGMRAAPAPSLADMPRTTLPAGAALRWELDAWSWLPLPSAGQFGLRARFQPSIGPAVHSEIVPITVRAIERAVQWDLALDCVQMPMAWLVLRSPEAAEGMYRASTQGGLPRAWIEGRMSGELSSPRIAVTDFVDPDDASHDMSRLVVGRNDESWAAIRLPDEAGTLQHLDGASGSLLGTPLERRDGGLSLLMLHRTADQGTKVVQQDYDASLRPTNTEVRLRWPQYPQAMTSGPGPKGQRWIAWATEDVIEVVEVSGSTSTTTGRWTLPSPGPARPWRVYLSLTREPATLCAVVLRHDERGVRGMTLGLPLDGSAAVGLEHPWHLGQLHDEPVEADPGLRPGEQVTGAAACAHRRAGRHALLWTDARRLFHVDAEGRFREHAMPSAVVPRLVATRKGRIVMLTADSDGRLTHIDLR